MGEIVSSVSKAYAQGDDLSLEFTVIDDDGNAVNITGATVRFQIFRRRGDTPVIDTEVSPATASVTLTTPASGIFTVDIDGDDTESLLGTYAFECVLIDTSSKESTPTRGWITFIT